MLRRAAKPFLVVGEGLVAPLMAVCLRSHGLHAHLLHLPEQTQTVDQASIVLPPVITNYLTEDLGLGGARPPGNVISSFYAYDYNNNVLMNLNLDALRVEDGGTFFCSQRSVIVKLLLRECGRSGHFLEHDNPVQMFPDRSVRLTALSEAAGGVRAKFSNGKSETYAAVINVSRDMDVVPLIDGDHEVTKAKRATYVSTHRRAVEAAPFYLDWTIPTPQNWEFGGDEMADIIHRDGRRFYVRPVDASNLSVTMTARRRGSVEECLDSRSGKEGSVNKARHYSLLERYWASGDKIQHPMWPQLKEALEAAVATDSKRVNYSSPTYCFDEWTEEGGRVIRVGPAAHASTAQPINVADAIDFQDCYLLAEHLGRNGLQDIDDFLDLRRKDAVDEMNAIALVDDFSIQPRSRISFAARRSYYMWSKTFSRGWKRALRPFC